MQIRVLGAGYAGVRAALDLDWRFRRRDVRISLINRDDHHELITELHRPAAGKTRLHALAIPLRDIFAGTRVELVRGTVTDIRLDQSQVVLDAHRVLHFDRLVVALGSEPEYFSIPGLPEHSLTLSSLNGAAVLRQHIEAMFAQAAQLPTVAERRPFLTVVVAGGGFTGVEFAGELADTLPLLARRHRVPRDEVRVITVEAAPDILPGFDEPLIDAAVEMLLRKGVHLMLGVPISAVEPGAVVLRDGTRIAARTIVWSGGVRANRLVERCFTTRSRGRALVNEYLQSVDDPRVYVVGDAALAINPKTGQPVPPTAQHAVQQGRIAARNLWAQTAGRPLRPYRPTTVGVVATVGHGVGLARIGPFKLAGRFPAVLKDINTWRYIYSLGGPRLVLKVLWRQLPLGLARA